MGAHPHVLVNNARGDVATFYEPAMSIGPDKLEARTLPAVVMPARDRFVTDDRRGGTELL